MEKNQIIGFGLIFIILVGWSIINAPSEEERQKAEAQRQEQLLEKQAQEQEVAQSNTETVVLTSIPTTQVSDSASLIQQVGQYGIFAPAASGTSSESILENEVIKITFDNKGGKIISAHLKGYTTRIYGEDNKQTGERPLILFEDEKNRWNYKLNLGNLSINSEDLYFTPHLRGNTLSFKATTSSGGYIEQSYSLADEGFKLDYDININGLGNNLNGNDPIILEIDNYLDKLERNDEYERRFSTIYFKPVEDDSDYCNCSSDDIEDFSNDKVTWLSFSNQFFNTSLMATDQPFDGLVAETVMYDESNPDLKKTSAVVKIPFNGGQNESMKMALFIGPNDYTMLKEFDNDLEEIIPFGRSLFGDINRHLIRPFFNFLSGFIGSTGIVIIVLIFIVKMVFYPLTYKMLHSQAKMGVLKPQIAGLKTKFKDDSQKVQMETMKIYREYGVSPFGGCLPMFVQMPIWYALFRFFPASISFRQEKFLWANDLSSYDALISLPFDIPGMGTHLSLFTILWGFTTVIYTYYNTKHMDMSANPAMKYVQYAMPLMFFVFFNKYASGLTCYMFFSQLFTVAQTILTKQFIFNDEKILAELNIQKAKPKKKKSGFMQKLQEAQERQQQDVAKKKKGKK